MKKRWKYRDFQLASSFVQCYLWVCLFLVQSVYFSQTGQIDLGVSLQRLDTHWVASHWTNLYLCICICICIFICIGICIYICMYLYFSLLAGLATIRRQVWGIMPLDRTWPHTGPLTRQNFSKVWYMPSSGTQWVYSDHQNHEWGKKKSGQG